MKLLIAHNQYKQSGGEDESFSSETGAIAPVPRISAEFERSGLGTCP